MSSTEKIFAYGTLRPPVSGAFPDDSRYYLHVAPYIEAAMPAQLPDAELFDLGSYPAVQPGQGIVYGDLLAVKPAGLEIADRIEGHPHFFRRSRVTVQTDQETIEAWVYWAPEGLALGRPRIKCGDWFQRNNGDCKEGISQSKHEQLAVDDTLQALVQRFAEAECSWLSSIRPNGRAHAAPVWHVWQGGRIYVVTTSRAIKTVNIEQNPSVVVTHPDPKDPVIIEGWATRMPMVREQLRPLFQEKYDWDIGASPDYDTIIEIVPTKLMAWGKHGEGRWQGSEILAVGDKLSD